MFNKLCQLLSLMLDMNSKNSTTIFLKIWPMGENQGLVMALVEIGGWPFIYLETRMVKDMKL